MQKSGFWVLPAAAFVLLAAAFHNGYPLVYSDTGTYIASGFEGKVPMDRPIAYGLFLRHASLAASLWLPVFLQALLTAWLLCRLFGPSLGEKRSAGAYFFLLVALCALTALPWYAGQLMPDIFTAAQLMIVALVLTAQDLRRWEWVLLGFVFVFCCLTHFSNLFIGLLTVAGTILPQVRKNLPHWRRRALVLTLWSASAFVAMPTLNWALEGSFSLGKGSSAFLIGRFIDSGMLKMYLDDHCTEHSYRLCAYKDSLPDTSRKFHWDANSPLYKAGGWGAPAAEAEYRAIVRGTLSSPKYLGLHFWESLLSTPSQLMQNAIGSGLDYGWYRSPASPPYQSVQRFFPHEFNEYFHSRQCGNLWKQNLRFEFFNEINFWVQVATLLAALWLLAVGGRAAPLWWVLVLGVVANAFVTSSLAVICDRFSPRVTWLLTAWVLAQWIGARWPRRET
jgi:hypothetical protein